MRLRALKSRTVECFMSEKALAIFLYFRLRFGLGFSMAHCFGKTYSSSVDYRNIYNSGKTGLLVNYILVSRTRSGSQLLGANS